jgi:6-phosphogluconolactonase
MITEFKTKNDLENMLLKTIYNDILQIVSKSGEAKLLLSGGSTPTSLYLKLNQMFLNWEQVICGLTDERNVNTNDDASNEKLIRSTLLLNKPDSNFIGMKNNDLELHENLIYANTVYNQFNCCDIILLGMGEDGHIASIFPNDNLSIDSLLSKDNVVQTNSPNEPKIRFSISPKLIAESKKCYLFFTGEKKIEQFHSNFKNLPITWIKSFITNTFYSKNT